MTEWLTIRVVLEGDGETDLVAPPGRVLLAHPDHTFADLAEAIDAAFGRWDLSPQHEFTVDDRRLVLGGDPEDSDVEDSEDVTIGEVGARIGAPFAYVFDLGEGWRHECRIEELGVDPQEAYGEEPSDPVPIWGWGTVPDQYGRETEDDDFDDVADEGLPAREGAAPELTTSASWEVVERALRTEERPRPDGELERALMRLREHAGGSWALDVLLTGAGLDADDLAIGDHEDLWLSLAAVTFEPDESLPLEPDDLDAWAALEPADYAGAVIGLVRGGEGQPADPGALPDVVGACPEVESEDLSEDERDTLVDGFGVVTALWEALGAIDARYRLTALGRWGLPKALRSAWIGAPETD